MGITEGEETMRRLRSIAPLVLFLGLAGCGGDGLKRVPVQGKITIMGKPLDNATIQFLPTGTTKGEGGIGRSDAEGNFTLTGSRKGAQGLVPGEYKVSVSRLVEPDGSPLPADAKEAEHPNARESVPSAYAALDSPLSATVPETGGSVQLDIPVKLVDPRKRGALHPPPP
jgi:hypothetical protein